MQISELLAPKCKPHSHIPATFSLEVEFPRRHTMYGGSSVVTDALLRCAESASLRNKEPWLLIRLEPYPACRVMENDIIVLDGVGSY